MRLIICMVLVTLSVVLCSCFSVDTMVKVKPDGSGTVIQTTMVNSAMMEQMQGMLSGMVQQMGAKGAEETPTPMPDLFTEKEARARTTKMGVGVAFVSSRKLMTGKAQGMEATYAFKDITQLKISEKPATPGPHGLGMASSGPEGETTFRLEKLSNGHTLVTILSPMKAISQPGRKDATAPSVEKPPPAPSAEQMEMARKLFEGMRFSLVMEVQGNLVSTNCPYVDGSRVTLLEMDFAQLLNNEDLFRSFSGLRPQSLDEAKELFKRVRGFKINLEPETKIEFEQ